MKSLRVDSRLVGDRMSGVSRRTLLKGGIAGLSSVVLGPDFFWQCLGSESAQGRSYVSLFTGRVTQGTPTTCGLCPAGCGLLAFVDEGRLVGLAGNPEHPYNQGALCVFGSAALQMMYGPSRIRKPLRRLGNRGEGRWEEIPWEEALGIVTKALSGTKVKAEPKTGGLAVCVPTREATPLVERFLAFHPQGLLALSDAHEHSVETAAHRSFSPGFDGQPDLAKADQILNFGANPLGSIRRLVGSARQWAEGQSRGATWITLDPRLSETAAASHTWIPLRPGTDGIFALALAHQILKHGWEDRAFLESATDADRYTLWELLVPWTPEKVGDLCQVPAERIRWTAETFARADRPVAILGSGVTARSGGLEDAQAVLMLNFLVGNIGREGGYGLPGGIEWQQPAPMPVLDREALSLRGTLFWELQKGSRKIGCLLSHDANPAVTDPDPGETAKALRDESRVPFHVALASGWNETVRLADLVLPASTFLESWGLFQPSAGAGTASCVSLRQPVCGPTGDTRSLDELLLEIAGSLGGDWKKAFLFRGVEDYYRTLLGRSLSEGTSAGGFREAKEQGFLVVPPGTTQNVGEKYRVKSVLSRSVSRVAEGAGERERKGTDSAQKTLILYAAPTRGGLDYPSDWVDEIDHADPVMVHPRTAEGLGLRDGDWVMLTGPAGSLRTRVRLTEGIHPEGVAMAAATLDRESKAPCSDETAPEAKPGGRRWWEAESYGSNARQVIPWPENPNQEAPGWMDTAVTVRKL